MHNWILFHAARPLRGGVSHGQPSRHRDIFYRPRTIIHVDAAVRHGSDVDIVGHYTHTGCAKDSILPKTVDEQIGIGIVAA